MRDIMVNNYRKGRKNKRKAKKFLKDENTKIADIENTTKYGKEKDAFGLFDLMCLTEEKVGLIQVTSNRPHVHKDFEEFKKKYSFVKVIQMVWVDYHGFDIYKYQKDSHEKVIEEKMVRQ